MSSKRKQQQQNNQTTATGRDTHGRFSGKAAMNKEKAHLAEKATRMQGNPFKAKKPALPAGVKATSCDRSLRDVVLDVATCNEAMPAPKSRPVIDAAVRLENVREGTPTPTTLNELRLEVNFLGSQLERLYKRLGPVLDFSSQLSPPPQEDVARGISDYSRELYVLAARLHTRGVEIDMLLAALDQSVLPGE